jgi:hypothetical protein
MPPDLNECNTIPIVDGRRLRTPDLADLRGTRQPLPLVTAQKDDVPMLSRDQRERLAGSWQIRELLALRRVHFVSRQEDNWPPMNADERRSNKSFFLSVLIGGQPCFLARGYAVRSHFERFNFGAFFNFRRCASIPASRNRIAFFGPPVPVTLNFLPRCWL